ncbi:MAG TPA: DUF2490 domain-containing protein [Bacteroidales bacterium]|nr:DUF2490 domain-containing protein [Bacteroidales bacterium]HOH83950.1 DUF2490 domain-containing protein [Bacteroidales bacterium]HPB26110.1 DUF2490 domain-containing protein [Bacteroidales bacterium]HPI29968.1 DUF2490 domain-containing protein [Bacteroidales bacterium]HQN16843.1 DUF2490 domain-containing protein [Bacteroidales bacterium]
MKKIHFSVVALMLVILFSINSTAQTQDANLWMNVAIEKKITPKFSIGFSQEFRMNENISELGTFFTDLCFEYKISKIIRVSANYRFVNKRRLDDSYSKRHRYYFDLTFRKKFSPVIISLRTRFQSQYKDVLSSNDGKIPTNTFRNKLTIKYNAEKKLQPYIFAEIYTPLKQPYDIFIDNTRYCAGVEYEINRMHTLDFYYLFQKEYHVKNPVSDHVFGIGYHISL